MIAGAGFAMMAWKLALRRTYPDPSMCEHLPEQMTERCSGAAEYCEHCEYYNILDAAARYCAIDDADMASGRKPFGTWRL